MNKKEYLDKLQESLKNVNEETRKELISDYEEHFIIGKEKGKTEAQIAKKLGDPEVIAKEFRVENLIQTAEKDQSATNLFSAVLATIGVSLFNLVFVVGPFFGIVGTLIGLIVTGITLIGSGVLGVILVLIQPYSDYIELGVHPAAAVLLSLSVSFFGIFFSILVFYLSKGFYKLTIKYLKFNLNLIKKGSIDEK